MPSSTSCFSNYELGLVGEKPLSFDRVVDTLAIARRRHPAGPNTLDALCKRYWIDNSQRTKHGALVDSLLLAEVYVELLGERQATFGLQSQCDARLAIDQRSGAGRSVAAWLGPSLCRRVSAKRISKRIARSSKR